MLIYRRLGKWLISSIGVIYTVQAYKRIWFLVLKVCGLNSLFSVGGCFLSASGSRAFW